MLFLTKQQLPTDHNQFSPGPAILNTALIAHTVKAAEKYDSIEDGQ